MSIFSLFTIFLDLLSIHGILTVVILTQYDKTNKIMLNT